MPHLTWQRTAGQQGMALGVTMASETVVCVCVQQHTNPQMQECGLTQIKEPPFLPDE